LISRQTGNEKRIIMETISNQHKFAGNPRKMSPKEKAQLKKHLETLGDLSGVIYDINSYAFVGGNQRSDIFDGAPIEITERFDKPTKNKTVAHGFILYNGEKYAYREVAFTESEFREACIVANNDGGEFDLEILSGWDEVELEEWGFDVAVFEDEMPIPILEEEGRASGQNYFNITAKNQTYFSIGDVSGIVDIDLLQAVENKAKEKIDSGEEPSEVLTSILLTIRDKW